MTPYYSKAYLSTGVNTADRVGLVIALYEGVISSATRAMEAIEEGDDPTRREAIDRASKILMGLCEALDYSQGEGLSGKLFGIYNFLLTQLLEANRTGDIELLQGVKSTMGVLLSGWQKIQHGEAAAEVRADDDERRLQSARRSAVLPSAAKRAVSMTA